MMRDWQRIQIPPLLVFLVIFARPLSCHKKNLSGMNKTANEDERVDFKSVPQRIESKKGPNTRFENG